MLAEESKAEFARRPEIPNPKEQRPSMTASETTSGLRASTSEARSQGVRPVGFGLFVFVRMVLGAIDCVHLKPASKERIKTSHFEGMIAGSAARLHISVNEPTQSEFATSHIDAGQAWEVASRDRSWPTGAFCQFVPPAGTRAGLSQRDNLHLWQRSRTPFYFIFIFFVRFSAPRDIHRRNA